MSPVTILWKIPLDSSQWYCFYFSSATKWLRQIQHLLFPHIKVSFWICFIDKIQLLYPSSTLNRKENQCSNLEGRREKNNKVFSECGKESSEHILSWTLTNELGLRTWVSSCFAGLCWEAWTLHQNCLDFSGLILWLVYEFS